MFDKIEKEIKDKKIILFGEIHGTREIPKLLSQFFLELAKKEDFNVCFEIPEEFQSNPEKFFGNPKFNDGKNSKEYFELIRKLDGLNGRHGKKIKINFIVPSNAANQEELEIGMVENIKRVSGDKKTFIILGDIHASKNPLSIGKLKMKTAGSILFEGFGKEFFNIRIVPKSGEFFNFGIKKVDENFLDEDFNKNFDKVYFLEKVTPCSF